VKDVIGVLNGRGVKISKILLAGKFLKDDTKMYGIRRSTAIFGK